MDDRGSKTPLPDIRELILTDHVGFDSLPHQLVKKRTQEGFVFNILLVGETGIGKTTLVSSLFNVPMDFPEESHANPAVELKFNTHNLEEKGVSLKLTIIETDGYGDQINRNENIDPIVDYVQSQFEKWLREESKFQRDLSLNRDTRVHACLYLVCPTGHSLKSIDLACLKRLQNVVNIIPVIAKSDSLSKSELQTFKAAIQADLRREDIKIYEYPAEDYDVGDGNVYPSKTAMPFAVAASGEYFQVGDSMVRARKFPWGTMLVEDEEHSEFLSLKDMLVVTNMEDMREKTQDGHYGYYRRNRLEQSGFPESFGIEEIEGKWENLRRYMLENEENLTQKFVDKVKAAESQFKEQESRMRSAYDTKFQEIEVEMGKILDRREELESKILEFHEKSGIKSCV